MSALIDCPAFGMRRRPALVLLGVAVACLFFGGLRVTPSFAEGPWWHVTSSSRPRNLPPGGEGSIVVAATNLGDAEANGASIPVSITDKLPKGLEATKIEGAYPALGLDNNGHDHEFKCSLELLRCTLTGKKNGFGFFEPVAPVLPYEAREVRIRVKVEPNAPSGTDNETTVSGGGAPTASGTQAVTVSSEPTPFGVERYELRPENEDGSIDTQAGSHPFQLTTTINLNQAAEFYGLILIDQNVGEGEFPQVPALTHDLHFNLPPGLIGNPTPFPRCPEAEFLLSGCPANTQVGVASVTVTEPNAVPEIREVVALVNLVPNVGEPARFGFDFHNVPVILDTSVRTGGDYGVVVSVNNISEVVSYLASEVTFWGVPGDPRHNHSLGLDCLDPPPGAICPSERAEEEAHPPPLLTLPTSCTGPLQTSVEADSWLHPGGFLSAPATEPMKGMDGCNRLGFEPSISVAPDGQAASTPTGLTVGIHVPQEASLNPTGLAESTVKEVTVALPAGVVVNPAVADGLQSCGLGEIGLESPGEQSCPEAAKIATVEIKTPLLPNPLVGAFYLAAQNANPFGSLVAVYLVAHDPVSGVLIKLAGEVKPDPVTGQLVARFPNIPPLPFEDGVFHFFGGSRAPLGTPALCGGYTTTASIEPWSGNAAVDSSSEFKITSGPNGSPCSNPLPFDPSLTTGSLNIQAGAFTPFTTTMSREDGQQNLQGIQLHMPPGLSGLLSGVKLCGEAEANAGTCGPESLIGETTVSVGLGGNPFSVKGGRVYITGPYQGAPFGLSIVNPAKAGPYDLEKNTACDCVVVRAKIEVDPHTAQLTITTDNTGPYKIPTIIQGIPLQIQHVNVTISREHFTFNPTNCNKMAITGSLLSTEGASSALSVPFQVTNCAVLKFAPKFAVSTSGKTSRSKGASLNVKLTYPKAPFGSQANIARVKVDLPKQLPSRLTTLQKACTAAQFELNPANCPKASFIGHAKATTPLIPVPLEGPAIFVSHGGEAFPSLIVVLQGYGVTLDLVGSTFISKAGITSSTFKTVPDAPVGSFELTLPEGKYSALAANGTLCKSKPAMPTAFVAQNGAEIHESTKITVSGCAKATKAKKSKKGKGKKK